MRGRKRITLTAEQEAWLRENFPDTSNKEICERLGFSGPTLRKIAKRLGIRKVPGFLGETRRICGERFSSLYASERRRVRAGLPQRTRLMISFVEQKEYQQRYYLRSRGYEIGRAIDGTGRRVAYWDAGTRRATRLEKNGSRWFRFKPKEEAKADTPPPPESAGARLARISASRSVGQDPT